MIIKKFTRDDTNVIKGVAILSIILHNLLHWISPSPGENEFDFYRDRVNNFIDGIINCPLESINLIISYFGHYGVQLFVFVSGMGLAYSMCKKPRTWGNFMIDRIKKLYPLLLTGILFFVLAKVLIYNVLLSSYDNREIGLKLLFLHTLLPDSGLSVNGPWWFFALIIQLYVLFPFMFELIRKYNLKALILLCLFSYTCIYLSQYVVNINKNVYLLQNAPGHIPEFALGIWFALNKDRKVNNIFGFLAVIVFVLGNFYKMFFPFTFLSFTFMMVWLFNSALKNENRNGVVKRLFIYYGSISMVVFAIHGCFRTPFVELANNLGTFDGKLLSAFLFVVLITLLSLPAEKIYYYLVSLFDKIHLFISKRFDKLDVNKKERLTRFFSRAVQFMIVLFFACYFFDLFYVPKHIRESQMIYERFSDIDNSVDECFTNVKVDIDGNKYLAVDSDNTYVSLMPNIKIYNSGNIESKISFDIRIDNNISEEDLPLVVFQCSDVDFWKGETLNFVESDIPGWQRVEISTSLIFNRSIKNKILKVYIWNKDNIPFDYDNIDVILHY
ncbi:MAG TPA: acyltransferase [Bacteroidetes bacterium]|nr:acyltransferase [Candidatus Limimorpha avicola]